MQRATLSLMALPTSAMSLISVVTVISMPGAYVPMWKPAPAEPLSPMPCALQLPGSLTAGNGWSLLEVGKAFSSAEAWQPQPLLSW